MTTEEFGRCYVKHLDFTLKFLRKKGATNGLAEDLAQEAWAKGFENIDQLNGGELKIAKWINTIALNVLTDFYRRNPLLTSSRCIPIKEDNEEGYINKIDCKKILELLPEADREILLLCFNDYDPEEIGELLGLGIITTRVRICRAKKKAREILTGIRPNGRISRPR